MQLLQKLFRSSSVSGTLLGLTLAVSAAFKAAAFAREAFIAAKFGLSSVTDAYFGLQQFPLIVSAFMFGAFALAFAPAYEAARRRSGMVAWLPGLLLLGCLAGLGATALMLIFAPFLLHAIHSTVTPDVWRTLAILSANYVPIVCIGIWAGICTARGLVLRSLSITGLPYLIMTATLLGIYAAGRLGNLSLPLSMTAGFGLVGAYSLVCILRSQPFAVMPNSLRSAWKLPDFRNFLRQLGASSLENNAYAVNQLLLLYFLSRIGTGVLSANNCAMRIGLLGYSLLAQPLAQLIQARLCAAESRRRHMLFRAWTPLAAGSVILFALALFALRVPAVRLAYMHGKFQGAEVSEVAAILPAWIGYFVVMSMNALVARYLFLQEQGTVYVRRQLCAYAAANGLRLAIAGQAGAAGIIWCSVIAEAVALAFNTYTCFKRAGQTEFAAQTADEVA